MWPQTFTNVHVYVEDTVFSCDSCTLSANSHVFREILWSSKQKQVHTIRQVHLPGVTTKAFQVLLQCMHCDCCSVSTHNVKEVWQAAILLRMNGVAQVCKQFAVSDMSPYNVFDYLRFGASNDAGFHGQVLTYMAEHFDFLYNKMGITELSREDLARLVNHPNITLNSEEPVLLAVLKWVGFTGPSNFLTLAKDAAHQCNDVSMSRLQALGELISMVRLTSVSCRCLQDLIDNPLISRSEGALRAAMTARELIYGLRCYANSWPTFALSRLKSPHRDISFFLTETGHTRAYVLGEKTLSGDIFFPSICGYLCHGDKYHHTLSSHNSNIYLIGYKYLSEKNFAIFKLQRNLWKKMYEFSAAFPGEEYGKFINVVINNVFYLLHLNSGTLLAIDIMVSYQCQKISSVPSTCAVHHLMSYKNTLIAFGDCRKSGRTLAMFFDTITNAWTGKAFIGCKSASGMTSFKVMDDTFILTSGGDLYVVSMELNEIVFKLVTRLANFCFSMFGSVVYGRELFLFGAGSYQATKVPKILDRIITVPVDFHQTAVVSAVVDRKHKGVLDSGVIHYT